MASAVQNLQTLYAQVCCCCGIEFAMPTVFDARRRLDHGTFYCPSGHGQSYAGETEAAKLGRELAAANQRAEMEAASRRAAERQAAKAKADKRRLMKRVNCGVCPHCQRTVAQLAAHIKTKHPGITQS